MNLLGNSSANKSVSSGPSDRVAVRHLYQVNLSARRGGDRGRTGRRLRCLSRLANLFTLAAQQHPMAFPLGGGLAGGAGLRRPETSFDKSNLTLESCCRIALWACRGRERGVTPNTSQR